MAFFGGACALSFFLKAAISSLNLSCACKGLMVVACKRMNTNNGNSLCTFIILIDFGYVSIFVCVAWLIPDRIVPAYHFFCTNPSSTLLL
jgi:hypothetical protein